MFQFSGLALVRQVFNLTGFPHSEISRIKGYLLLPVAYRSLSRPSSPLRAKAFSIRSSLFSFSNDVDAIVVFYFHY